MKLIDQVIIIQIKLTRKTQKKKRKSINKNKNIKPIRQYILKITMFYSFEETTNKSKTVRDYNIIIIFITINIIITIHFKTI